MTKNGGMIEVKDVTKLMVLRGNRSTRRLLHRSHAISVYVDTTDGDKQYTVTATNYKLPDMKIYKTDAQTGAPIPGTVFSVKSVTGSYSTSVTTGVDGSATLPIYPPLMFMWCERNLCRSLMWCLTPSRPWRSARQDLRGHLCGLRKART